MGSCAPVWHRILVSIHLSLQTKCLLTKFSACVTSSIRLKYFMTFGKSFDPTCKSSLYPILPLCLIRVNFRGLHQCCKVVHHWRVYSCSLHSTTVNASRVQAYFRTPHRCTAFFHWKFHRSSRSLTAIWGQGQLCSVLDNGSQAATAKFRRLGPGNKENQWGWRENCFKTGISVLGELKGKESLQVSDMKKEFGIPAQLLEPNLPSPMSSSNTKVALATESYTSLSQESELRLWH